VWSINFNALIYFLSSFLSNIRVTLILGLLIVIIDPYGGKYILKKLGAILSIAINSFDLPENHILNYLLRLFYIFPTYGLHLSLEAGIILKCVREYQCPTFTELFKFSNLTIGILLMLLHSIILILLAWFIESKKENFILFKPFFMIWKRLYQTYNPPNGINVNEDDDVSKEREIIKNDNPNDSTLFIRDLSKAYDKN
jgi:hypothetical protein